VNGIEARPGQARDARCRENQTTALKNTERKSRNTLNLSGPVRVVPAALFLWLLDFGAQG